ncbi:LOW QUALITY PROTEIN: Hypothetical protein PHPALM_20708 [Phytophthora palmivora]|uniref:Uncharacterized protein n=1 Tax=Phytophthora palmivora TaxID=4796 RepID=A0A2P4XE60_9STRA|nr:LOW QUALITY PROTEIN: Hypothetical protein PHPALM_20708 [Phytophthora palmivora]
MADVNGSIERINRDILQVISAMIVEYKVSYKDCVYLVPLPHCIAFTTQAFTNGTIYCVGTADTAKGLAGCSKRKYPITGLYGGKQEDEAEAPKQVKGTRQKLVNFTVIVSFAPEWMRSMETNCQSRRSNWTYPHQVSDDTLDVTDERLDTFRNKLLWKGFQHIENSYESMGGFAKASCVLLSNYVTSVDDQQLREHWRKPLGDQSHNVTHEVRSNLDCEAVSPIG